MGLLIQYQQQEPFYMQTWMNRIYCTVILI